MIPVENDADRTDPPFDPEEALSRIGGDLDLLKEMIDIFISCSGEDLMELEKAMDSGDRDLIRRNAHRIKGSIGNFGLNEAYNAAYALEMCAKEGVEDLQVRYEDLRARMFKLTSSLMRFLSS
jgi:two-component system sensor histidine kinase/response regulator